eukprot:748118-Hanusia_phi.AAC.3
MLGWVVFFCQESAVRAKSIRSHRVLRRGIREVGVGPQSLQHGGGKDDRSADLAVVNSSGVGQGRRGTGRGTDWVKLGVWCVCADNNGYQAVQHLMTARR